MYGLPWITIVRNQLKDSPMICTRDWDTPGKALAIRLKRDHKIFIRVKSSITLCIMH